MASKWALSVSPLAKSKTPLSLTGTTAGRGPRTGAVGGSATLVQVLAGRALESVVTVAGNNGSRLAGTLESALAKLA